MLIENTKKVMVNDELRFSAAEKPKREPELVHQQSTTIADFDDLLPFIGEFGRYQKLMFLAIVPFMFSVAFVYFTTIFLTLEPDRYFCRVPELAALDFDARQKLAIPRNDKCHQYAVNYTELLANGVHEPDPEWPIVPCQAGWDYDFSDTRYATVTTEFNWVCSRGAYASVAQAVFFVGAICGGLIFGWIADYHGRRPALILTNSVGFAVGFATAFVSSFPLFLLSRFLIGFAFDNCFTMMYIISLEYVGSKYRTFVANMSIAIFFTIATCLLPWIAVYLSDWRTLSLVTSVPSLCGIFIAIWFIPESARWLISKGEIDRAIEITKRIAKFNRKTVSEKVFIEFQDNCRKQDEAETPTATKKSYSFLDLFRTPRLRRITILLIVIWMSISLVFDGHVRNVGSLGLDFFATFTMACATEFPADTFLTLVLDRWGRRWLAFATMACSGLFSLCSTLVPVGLSSAALAICGRMAVNIAYNIGLQYAAEVLPTVVRAQGVAVVHLMGYVACIIAPFIVLLAKIDRSIPFVILGVIGIVGGLLSLFLPETLNKDLPQTLDDGENFGTDQKFWSVPCLARNGSETDAQKSDNFCRYRQTNNEIEYLSRTSFRGIIRSSVKQRPALAKRNSFDLS